MQARGPDHTTRRPPILLGGPPVGAGVLARVGDRLGGAEAIDVVDGGTSMGWRERAAALAPRLEGRVVVAHGLAVPVAVAAALDTRIERLVLVNGPITRLDPVTSVLARVAALPGFAAILHPSPWLAWLRSSVGLRRLVVNPYVMDRDTVAALCGPAVADAPLRAACARYLRSLAQPLPDATRLRVPLLLAWGDDDALYPPSEAAFLQAAVPGSVFRSIPGGRFLHPEERPWALADLIASWLAEPAAATSVS